MERRVCKYFQTGYCKFGVNCRKLHVNEMCLEEQWDKRKCNKRQPNVCKYFSTQIACKFGDMCCYKHGNPHNKSDTTDLEVKISQLEAFNKNMCEQITNLEHKIEAMQKVLSNKSTFE